MAFKKGIGGINPGTGGKMVQMVIQVPQALKDAMREIWETQGYTMSQQARLSLALWVKMHAKDPSRVDTLFAMAVSPRSVQAAVEAELTPSQRAQREALRVQERGTRAERREREYEQCSVPRKYRSEGHSPDYNPDKDPEPEVPTVDSPAEVKSAYSSWRRRRGDYAVALLAQGKQPPKWDVPTQPQPKPAPGPSPLPDWLAPHVPKPDSD